MVSRIRIGTVAAAVVALLMALPASIDRPASAAYPGPGLAGQMLVARRSMADPRFAESVIFMVRHDRTGALGLIVNKPIVEVPFADYLRRMGVDPTGAEGTVRVHLGGPVQPNIGFVLHSADYTGEDTIVVDDAMALTAGGSATPFGGIGSGSVRCFMRMPTAVSAENGTRPVSIWYVMTPRA